MLVSAIQLQVTDEQSPADRIKAAEEAVALEAERGAELVVLPEMWLPGYFGFDVYEEVAEPLGGPTLQRFSELAEQSRVVLLAGSFVERSGEELYNTSVVFDSDGSLLTRYRKIHLFGYGSKEQQVLTRGTEPATFEALGATIGVSTCYDLRFPELYRQMVTAGTEVYLVVAGWPFPRLDAWRTLARARSIENQAGLVACNTSGRQGPAVYLGASVAYNAWGACLGELDERPGVLRCDIDLEAIRSARREFPVLEHRVL
jgi:predicted amidohydrolase